MDTSRFAKEEDGFPLLDLTAKFTFKTSSSISFHLGRMGSFHPPNQPDFVFSGFEEIGWVDVHHPCDSAIKAQIRICIPTDYHSFERMAAMVKIICEALAIPLEENCESTVFDTDHVTGILPKVYFGTG
jgi:hypothetical protein